MSAQAIHPGFRVFTSNRMERLVERLCGILAEPSGDPFAPEIVVVQSRGMERWVSLEIAMRLGVCANVRFPFPNAILADLAAVVLGEIPDPKPFDPGFLTWRVLKQLHGLIDQPAFESLQRYLREGEHPAKPLQLAHRLASLFDQYLVFRPEMVLAWEEGNDPGWQAQLWRALIQDGPARHHAVLRRALLSRLGEPDALPDGIPRRLSIFGISALPPFHMEVFKAISRFCQVNLFFLNPCSHYWADLPSGRWLRTALLAPSRGPVDAQWLHLDPGHPLLASMGKLGMDFFRLIQELAPEEHDAFEDPGEETLLAAIQRDILLLEERPPESRLTLASSDRSIEIHSCHSPMREIEVLHDCLLALFEEDPELKPRDILVMTPDIHRYAPYIQAVFDAQDDPRRRIPFTVTDRSLRGENRIAEHFLALLELPGTRFTASRVLSLLEVEAVRMRFQLTESELNVIRQWTCEAGIRWGMDERDRARLGFPRSLAHTWREGLDRMLLGYAMKGDDTRLFSDVLPYDAIEGSDATILDRLLLFVETLQASVVDLGHVRPLDAWAETLGNLLDTFFEPVRGAENDLLVLRRMLGELAEILRIASFDEAVALDAVRYWLGQRLDRSRRELGFITGGVTFCAMLPMRAIPFPVIALVGMDDGAFPRADRVLGFDLMAQSPRPGDRSQRADDRYLFLEAILSARRKLIISHVGQSQDDNASIPPSVLVSELLDVIEHTACSEDGSAILERVRTVHPLQPFSPAYFDPAQSSRLFSYSHDNCAAAISLRSAPLPPGPLLRSPLPEPEDSWRRMELFELTAFFSNPCRYLLTRRLQVRLETTGLDLADEEPFVLSNLEAYQLQSRLIEKCLEGLELGPYRSVAEASGTLPHGSVGVSSYTSLSRATEAFCGQLAPRLHGLRSESVAVNVSLGPYQLSGAVGPISNSGLIHYRPATIKPKDRLRLWIQHLALLCLPDLDWPGVSVWVGKEEGLELPRIDRPDVFLRELLDLYWRGLTRPLPFFPQTSLAYVKALLGGKGEPEALRSARLTWENDFAGQPDMNDPYVQLCFADETPLDDDFARTARTVLEPLLTHGRVVK